MSRTALVTGVGGFAGRHLAAQLVADGWTVHGTVRRRVSEVDGVVEHALELDDLPALQAVVGDTRPDAVFHLAAVVDTVATPDVLALHRSNYLGLAALLEALRTTRVRGRVLHTSSAFAYGRGSAERQPVRESDPLEPLTAYGASKAASEVLALQWGRETGQDVVVTRAFQHTGPGHVGAYALADWAAQLAGGASVLRVGNLDVARDYLDVRDVAHAYRALLDRGTPGAVYNVSRGEPVTMRALLDGLVAAFGGTARVEVDPARVRAVDQPLFYGDSTRLRQDTGWAPQYDLEQTLADLAAFWRQRTAA